MKKITDLLILIIIVIIIVIGEKAFPTFPFIGAGIALAYLLGRSENN